MKAFPFLLLIASVLPLSLPAADRSSSNPTEPVQVEGGLVSGIVVENGVRTFEGIPYAKPPLGDLRWKEPQSVTAWEGVKRADHFGPRPMQRVSYRDMVYRSDTISEDCLYLNVWAPVSAGPERAPVFVYFHGGGLFAGDGSETRYDGESLAQRGIIVVTVNYRLGVFGFLAYPALTAESPRHASGNYGLLDQNAALRWVQRNIGAFGGDPKRVTIGGQSAGSASVSAQMASPLSQGLFAGAIGESGSLLGKDGPPALAEAEQKGREFAAFVGATSLTDLRKMPGQQLLDAMAKPAYSHFGAIVDGYFLPETPLAIFSNGRQADVPLLAGWNSAEVGYQYILGLAEPTPENFKNTVARLYGERASKILDLYPAGDREQTAQSATDLASDRFIAYNTWKWLDVHSKSGGKPVFRYLYNHTLPPETNDVSPGGDLTVKAPGLGAPHSAEIAYAFGSLNKYKVYAWRPDDYKVSTTLQSYFAQFIKTGNPNGPGLAFWPWIQASIPKIMVIDTVSNVQEEPHLDRYELLDSF